MLFGFMDATCFGHSCGHLQCGKNKNINNIKMCLTQQFKNLWSDACTLILRSRFHQPACDHVSG